MFAGLLGCFVCMCLLFSYWFGVLLGVSLAIPAGDCLDLRLDDVGVSVVGGCAFSCCVLGLRVVLLGSVVCCFSTSLLGGCAMLIVLLFVYYKFACSLLLLSFLGCLYGAL